MCGGLEAQATDQPTYSERLQLGDHGRDKTIWHGGLTQLSHVNFAFTDHEALLTIERKHMIEMRQIDDVLARLVAIIVWRVARSLLLDRNLSRSWSPL